MRGVSWVAEDLVPSQEWLCPIELVSYLVRCKNNTNLAAQIDAFYVYVKITLNNTSYRKKPQNWPIIAHYVRSLQNSNGFYYPKEHQHLEPYSFIYDMFRPFLSAIIRQNHKYRVATQWPNGFIHCVATQCSERFVHCVATECSNYFLHCSSYMSQPSALSASCPASL
jgi:hypothetical protein